MFKYLFINTNNPSKIAPKIVLNFPLKNVRKLSTNNKAGKRFFLLQIILHTFSAADKILYFSQFFCYRTGRKRTHCLFMILTAFHRPDI